MLGGGPDLPATVGMYRPDLARLLTDRALETGVKIRYFSTVDGLADDGTGVGVRFADGSSGRYDLVIGADGVRSRTRSLLGIQLETKPLGMGIWRDFSKRPASVTHTDLYYGGPCYIAGYCPTSEDSLYCYLVEPAQDRGGLTSAQQLAVMRELSEAYHGPWDDIREGLTDPTRLSYRQFENHVLPPPWNRGRVVLIGDAAHICPPTLAEGASMAFEDPRSWPNCLSTATPSTSRCGTPSWAGGSSGRAPSWPRLTSSPGGCSTTSRATSRD